jgi:hypothetical protein
MVTLGELYNTIKLIDFHLISYSNVEITAYKQGSYFINREYRNGLEFLELYYLILNQSYNILNNGDELVDYNLDDDDVKLVIQNTYELLFYYGLYSVDQWILHDGVWNDLGVWIDEEIWID